MENLTDEELSSLWIDKPYMEKILNNLDFSHYKYLKKENIIQFEKDGFTILKNVIPHEDIDKLIKIIESNIIKNNNEIFCSYGLNIKKITDIDTSIPLTKILDLYVKINEASKILCHDSIKEFLELMYKGQVKLIQSLYFNKGSTQSLHQDPAYVVIEPHPYNLIAVWVALEDILEGSGELLYLPGSHKKLKFRYGNGRINFNNEKDKKELHNHHLFCLQEMSKEITPLKFFAKKGDILFWHAGLVHGGAPIINNELTCKSIVGHYCPSRENPYYYIFDNNRYTSKCNNIDIVSMYYKK